MVTEYNKAHIIAEAGVNHNGDFSNGKKLIDIAKDAGADSVKLQIINPYELYLPGDYKYGHYDIKKVIENRFSTVLTDEEYLSLYQYAKESGIAFSASIFDEKGLDLLMQMNPPYIKIASCDLNNVRLLRQVAERGVKMIISTGMSTLDEIEFSVNELEKSNFNNIVLLHCVSVYPCPLRLTNLNFITVLQEKFGYEVGFSDHTRGTNAAVAAYVMGVRWFEKHYTFDNDLEGFDHKHAQSISEFKQYISALRDIETSMSSKESKLTDKELYTGERARRSLYAARNIKKGEIINSKDILCVRPSGIMNAKDIDLLIGHQSRRDINKYSPFTYEDAK